jgi:di/tricarboxylate transporter
MTLPQGLSFAIVGLMLVLFLWDRLRFDVVALLALLVAILCGVVPMEKAFLGFSNPVVIIVASALVISQALASAGIAERIRRRIAPLMTSDDRQVGVLATLVAVLSALMKNVGALAIFIPVAIQVAEKRGSDRRRFLMPLSFASLVGGLMTLIGTSPNLLISTVRQTAIGRPYGMFDFAPVGLPIAVAAIVVLTFGWRLIPQRRRASDGMAARAGAYTVELRIPEHSPLAGKRVQDIEKMAEGAVEVVSIEREGGHRYVPARHWVLYERDVLVLESDPQKLQKLIDESGLELVGSTTFEDDDDAPPGEIGTIEAIVSEGSALVGTSARRLRLRDHYQMNLLAISRRGQSVEQRLRQTRFRVGDLLVLQGNLEAMPDTLAALGCLPVAGKPPTLGRRRRLLLPSLILGGAMMLAATQLVPVQIAFFGAAVMVVVLRLLSLKEAYDAVDWPVIMLLGCLIPIGQAVHDTGGSEVIAGWLAHFAAGLPPVGIVALLMIVSMLVTPVLHHAAAVLVMGPIAASLALQLGDQPDAFLMAVAVGASSDFLTPIGHQCNALVMGPGGYRFGDYWHLGLPLSATVILVGVPLIMLFWPLH